jgi:hypothetical protein
MKQKNLSKRIEMIESTAVFKSFLIRYGFHSYDEYMKLFWDNIFKRKVATDDCVETYPDLFTKQLQQWKD